MYGTCHHRQKGKKIFEAVWNIVAIAAPVFGGRIPAIVTQSLAKLNGTGKKAVTLVVYGNRAYEDALLELNDITEKCKFEIIASGAFIAQHSMNPDIAAGRPDDKDRKVITNFAEKVILKLNSEAKNKIKVPGNYPYKVFTPLPTTPLSLSACTLCQQCVSVCPTNAITMETGAIKTNPEKCILCMACTANCPENIRILPPPLQEKMRQMLGKLKSVHRENEFFL